MEQVSFVMAEGHMGYSEVMKLSVVTFFSLLKQFTLKYNLQDEDYRKQYEKMQYVNYKEPDLGAIRKEIGYREG